MEIAMNMHPARRRNPQLAGRAVTALLCGTLTLAGVGCGMLRDVSLTWKLEPGADLVYRLSMRSESELPQSMGTSTMHMDTTQRWSVLEVDSDGNATVRITTEGVRMEIAGPMGTMTMDSADETRARSPLDAIRVMVGTSYSVVLDPRGALLGMSGIDEMLDALRARIPDPSARTMLDQMVSEEALSAQWRQGMLSLPGEAVGVGSTWENAFTLPLPLVGSMTVATSHELESLDEELAVIHSSGTMGLADDALASSRIPMEFRDATIAGTTRFDADRGLLLDAETTIALQTVMTVGDQETALEALTTVTVELVE